MTSNEAECLINVPPVKYYDSLVNPGRIWSADDQCKLVYGNNATFCKVSDSDTKMKIVLINQINSKKFPFRTRNP